MVTVLLYLGHIQTPAWHGITLSRMRPRHTRRWRHVHDCEVPAGQQKMDNQENLTLTTIELLSSRPEAILRRCRRQLRSSHLILALSLHDGRWDRGSKHLRGLSRCGSTRGGRRRWAPAHVEAQTKTQPATNPSSHLGDALNGTWSLIGSKIFGKAGFALTSTGSSTRMYGWSSSWMAHG